MMQNIEYRIYVAASWAKQNLAEGLSCADIAQYAYMSESCFQRHFKILIGQPPYTWLIHQRLVLAQTLLKETKLNISDVATKCGFKNPNALRHNFNKVVGIPPGQFRLLANRS